MELKPFTKDNLEKLIMLTDLHPTDGFPAHVVNKLATQLLQMIEDKDHALEGGE